MLISKVFKCGEERSLTARSSSGKSSPCAMAALDLERDRDREHARKRKERRDSGCAHERKERRPQSEERPPPPPPLHDSNRLETERRAERLSRARRPHQAKRRRPAPQPPHRRDENGSAGGAAEESPRSPSPPRLDLAALHRQLGRDEPERSWGADEGYRTPVDAAPTATAAPAANAVRALPAHPTDNLADTIQPEQRLQKIKKKVHALRKTILKYESEFEALHGCSMSQTDRITDVQLTRMYEALQRLQAEKRSIKADPAEYAVRLLAARRQKEQDDKLDAALRSDKLMADLVIDIEEWLSGCRRAAGRFGPASGWSTAQLSAEKACVQRALLRLEAARGRPPTNSAERGAARHLYEQYRHAKRALAARSDAALGALNNELATILEHEPMLFTNLSVDSSSDSQEKQSDTPSEETSSKTPTSSPPTKAEGEELASSTSSAKSTGSDEQPSAELTNLLSNEGLHCLDLEELTKIHCETKLQKSVLRRSIKEYELTFETQNSRKAQKDDKKIKEDDYQRYKAVKARLRLINALMNKQKRAAT